MILDLASFPFRHPKVPQQQAQAMLLHAAVALQRHHSPGVSHSVKVQNQVLNGTLTWEASCDADAEQLDDNSATELGAEVVVLTLANAVEGWKVRRRLQRGESADWLLSDPEGNLVAFEVSGTVEGSLEARATVKRKQVGLAGVCRTKAIGIVRFCVPQSVVETL